MFVYRRVTDCFHVENFLILWTWDPTLQWNKTWLFGVNIGMTSCHILPSYIAIYSKPWSRDPHKPTRIQWIEWRSGAFFANWIHPWRLTWNIIMEVWKIIFLSKWVICRFHVNLPGCKCVVEFFWQNISYEVGPKKSHFFQPSDEGM